MHILCRITLTVVLLRQHELDYFMGVRVCRGLKYAEDAKRFKVFRLSQSSYQGRA